MLIGATLLKGDGTPYYSPMFPRGGLVGYFRVDAQTKWGTSPTLDISVEHRNEADTAWTTASSFTQITTVGSFALQVGALKELLRLKYTIGGTEVYAGWHFTALAPQWAPT